MYRPKNYYFLLPIIGAIPWGGMLIAMLAAWSIQGHPIYWFIHRHQIPVYISHIGATNLQPLFISCSAWQGLLYVITLIVEYNLRRTGKLQFWFKKDERNLLFAAAILGAIGQIGLILCSIFDTVDYSTLHHSMLGVFILFVLFSMICLISQYCLMGLHYRKIHIKHKYWNKFTISFYLKSFWTLFAFICAVCFELVNNKSTSSCFEWTLAFWYLVLFGIFSWDLFPAAKHEHKNYPHIKDWNNRGYYLYDKHFGNSSETVNNNEEQEVQPQQITSDSDDTAAPRTEEFTDEQLEQYPLRNNGDSYPIPNGHEEQVEFYESVEKHQSQKQTS